MTASNQPTRVGVNLLWLLPGVVGGSEEYTLNLLRAVSELQSAETGRADLRLRLYVQPSLASAHTDLGDRFELVALPREIPVKPARFAAESTWLAWQTRHDHLVHHGGGVMPYGTRGRSIVTLHDLQPMEMSANFSPAQRRWFGVMLPRAARAADRIITPSAFTAGRAVTLLGVPPDRVSLVPPVHGPPPGGHGSASATTPVDGRYLIYPAVSHPHKRHVDAVEAMHLLADRHPDLRLVLTGGPGSAAAAITEAITERHLEARVQVLGRVPADDLECLLRGASALVFPSVYEGFGNPVIEAMARRVPVVAADAAALPEVAGGAALLFEPRSPRALADCVDRLLSDPVLAERLKDAGSARAADFGADVAGKAILKAYRDALA